MEGGVAQNVRAPDGGNKPPSVGVHSFITTEPTPIPPAALLRENKTLLRQAAYYYMEIDPEQKRIATETLMRLMFGEYPSAMIDAIFQRGPNHQPDLYNDFFVAQCIDAFNQGQLLVPRRRKTRS